MICENCGLRFDPVVTRWLCPYCRQKASCCDGSPAVAQLSITCPMCGMTSFNVVDVSEGYCGNCHSYTAIRAG